MNENSKGVETQARMEVYDSSVAWLRNAFIKTVPGTYMFTEGPVWHPDKFFLFSDTPANRIYRLNEDNACEAYLENSGLTHEDIADLSDQIGSNGLATDKNNCLLICQHGDHAIARLHQQNTLEIIAGHYNGRPFNSPNDIIVRHNGVIFFTDPPYGLKDQVLHPGKFQPQAGIYAVNEGSITLVGNELKYPNGLFFSADQQWLYVSSNYPEQRYILRYRMLKDGNGEYDGVFMAVNADGMTTDKAGNIYLATNEGVLVVSPKGKRLALIVLPETPSNLAWGGEQQKTLLITARSQVYKLTLEDE